MDVFTLTLYLLIWFLTMAFGITCYVLNALGMYTIAKRRGIEKPWLAWIPVGSAWTLGCISDQYRYVVKGETKSKRKILLGLNIAQVACVILFYIIFFSTFFNLMQTTFSAASEEEILAGIFGMLGSIILLYIPMLAIYIVHMVFTFMAMYDLYTSCTPDNNVLFLLLSILLGIHPFIIFFIRKKDDGMPPRREPVQTVPPQIGWQPQQNWQNPQPNPCQPPQQYWQPPQESSPAQPDPGDNGGETTAQ